MEWTSALARMTADWWSREDLTCLSWRIWKKEERQTFETCLVKERVGLKVMPRLRASDEGLISVLWNVMEEDRIFDRCCGVPIRRYSVFEGLRERRFRVSHW